LAKYFFLDEISGVIFGSKPVFPKNSDCVCLLVRQGVGLLRQQGIAFIGAALPIGMRQASRRVAGASTGN